MKKEILKLIEFAINNVKNRIISTDTIFTKEDIFELQNTNLIYTKLVEAIEDGEYYVEVNCSDCGTDCTVQIDKMKLIDYIRYNRTLFLCDKCTETIRLIQHEKDIEDNTNQLLNICDNYYNYYQQCWNNLFSDKVNFVRLKKELLLIKNKSYSEYIQTNYWHCISYHLRKDLKKCPKCDEKKDKKHLHVHHKTYEHLGEEYLHLEDLIVLCDNCHTKEHARLKAIELNLPLIKRNKKTGKTIIKSNYDSSITQVLTHKSRKNKNSIANMQSLKPKYKPKK